MVVLGRNSLEVWTNSVSSSSPTPSGPASKNSYPRQTVDRADRSVTTAGSSKESSTGSGPVLPGGTCPTTSARGRQCGSVNAATPPTAPGRLCCRVSWPTPMPPETSTGRCRRTPQSTVLTSMRRTRPIRSNTQGVRANYTNQRYRPAETAGHGIGRSRRGLSTKIHAGVGGAGRSLSIVVTGGHHDDGAV